MDRTDGIRKCSITVHLKQTQQVSGGGVLLEACRVGSVNDEDGSIMLNWNMGELGRTRPSVSAEDLTKKLSAFLFGTPGDSETDPEQGVRILSEDQICRKTTGNDGTCLFDGLEEGAWLIHAADSSSYGRIEDALVSVPCFIERSGEWTGPVYDQDVWLKATALQETEENPSNPTPQKPAKETPGPSVPESPQATTETNRMIPQTEKTPKTTRTTTGTTSTSIHPVRTMDDSPLSSVIFTFLCSALVIAMLISALRGKGKAKGTSVRLLMVFFGAGMLLAPLRAMAEEPETGTMNMNGENRIVFVNEAPEAPALAISKEVLDAENGSRAPSGDVFTFRLKLNQERASRVKYRLFDARGIELVPSADGEGLVEAGLFEGVPEALRTGKDGSFTLTDGQTALFEDVSVGDLWEVTESDTEQYERILPRASDTITRTMESSGAEAHFINRYVPPREEGTEGVLEITKKILWPEEIPLPGVGSFRIRILVDQKPWSGALVERRNLYDQKTVEDVSTDENGCFAIDGNQTALLRNIPAGSDVFVEELIEEDGLFVPSGEVTWKGSVTSRQKVELTNRLASFVVTKSLKTGSSGRSFLFTLSGKGGQSAPGVSYYLVREDGSIESSEPRMTDTKGQFELHAGESAVFAGLQEGSLYSVREEKAFGYTQVTPTDPKGYSNLSIGRGIQTLLFENEASGVRLFAPSAGGIGIGLFTALSVMGMILISIRLIRRRRM